MGSDVWEGRLGTASLRQLGLVIASPQAKLSMRCTQSPGPVAQWIRHRPTEPGIAGSSPAGVIYSFGPQDRGPSRALALSVDAARQRAWTSPTPAIAQLAEHLTVEVCRNQMVPGSIPGRRICSLSFKAPCRGAAAWGQGQGHYLNARFNC